VHNPSPEQMAQPHLSSRRERFQAESHRDTIRYATTNPTTNPTTKSPRSTSSSQNRRHDGAIQPPIAEVRPSHMERTFLLQRGWHRRLHSRSACHCLKSLAPPKVSPSRAWCRQSAAWGKKLSTRRRMSCPRWRQSSTHGRKCTTRMWVS
jgi:hypothetical protein